MKKHFSKIISIFLVLTLLTMFIFHFSYNLHLQKNTYQKQLKKIKVYLNGAIEKPGINYFEKGSTLGQALALSTLQVGADLNKLDLERVLNDNEYLYIPKKGQRFRTVQKLKEIDLVKLKIPTKLRKEIFKYLKKVELPTWDGLAQIKGLGAKTIAKLQSILILQ